MTPFELKQRDFCIDFFEKASKDPDWKKELDINGLIFLATNYGMWDIRNFFQVIPKSTFLTVGDAYCAKEAVYLKTFGHWVCACDQATQLIEKSYAEGMIDSWCTQDVNYLHFLDEEFDFVFAKELLHHLSMPYKGLWEMLRVSKKGVIIIEPNGDGTADHLREQNRDFNIFEPVGNFCFAFRAHELSKIGASYGIKHMAYTYTSGYNQQVKEVAESWNSSKNAEVERARLIAIDQSKQGAKNKDMIIFFYFKDGSIFDLINEERYTKVIVP